MNRAKNQKNLRVRNEQVLGISTKNETEATLVSLALAGSITREEMYIATDQQPIMFSAKIGSELKKAGYAESVSLSRPVGVCEKCLVPTEKGYERAKMLIGGNQKISIPNRKLGELDVSEYANGYNLYSFIRMGKHIKWERNGKTSRADGSTEEIFDDDALVTYDSDRRIHIIEKTYVDTFRLLGEIEKKIKPNNSICSNRENDSDKRNSRKEDVYVFSLMPDSGDFEAQGAVNCFSARKIRRLLNTMERIEIKDARELLHRSDLYPEEDFLREIICRVDSFSLNRVIDKDFLTHMARDIDYGVCDFRFEQIRRGYFQSSFNALMEISRMLYGLEELGMDYEKEIILSLLRSGPVVIAPTALLAYRLPFLLPDEFPEYGQMIEKHLVDSFRCGEVTEQPCALKIGELMIVPQYFFLGQERSICVDFPGSNLAAWVRAIYILKNKKMFEFFPLDWVLFFNDEYEIQSFMQEVGLDERYFSGVRIGDTTVWFMTVGQLLSGTIKGR